MDNVPEETHDSGNGLRQKGRLSSPASHSKAKQTDGEGRKSSQGSGSKQENSLDNHADSIFVQKIRHVNSGILLWVGTTSLKKDVYMATSAISDMSRQKQSPTKGQRKVVRKDQLLC